ncbi:MAG: S-layer homology domain-containing protein [Patescibacteria group bacterium]
MRSIRTLFIACASIVSLVALNVSTVFADLDPLPFPDTPLGSSHYVAIEFLKKNSIIEGYSDGTFRPNDLVNRAEALAMIIRSNSTLQDITDIQQFNLPEDTIITLNFPTETNIKLETRNLDTPITLEKTGFMEIIMPQGGSIRAGRVFVEQEPRFTDVRGDEWFYTTIKRGYSLGIIQGYPDGTFRANNFVNRAEILSLLLRTNEITPTPFEKSGLQNPPLDIYPDNWHAATMAYAVERFLLNPTPDNLVFPGNTVTRGELAEIIYRFKQSENGMQFGKSTWYGDGLSKIYPRTHQEYVDQNLTTAHKTYAFGTVLRITNMDNGKTVDVVVNDRGPFVPGRVVDLSRTAFSKLEDPSRGVINASVEVLYQP